MAAAADGRLAGEIHSPVGRSAAEAAERSRKVGRKLRHKPRKTGASAEAAVQARSDAAGERSVAEAAAVGLRRGRGLAGLLGAEARAASGPERTESGDRQPAAAAGCIDPATAKAAD